jgi:hypothetical protein
VPETSAAVPPQGVHRSRTRGWPRWLRRGPLELLASLVIGAGVFMLLQPVSITLYSYSFVTTLAGVVAFMIVSRVPD